MWFALLYKVPTWEKMRKHQIVGSGLCPLCKAKNESIAHILIFFPFTMKVWTETFAFLRQPCDWNQPSLESTWKN